MLSVLVIIKNKKLNDLKKIKNHLFKCISELSRVLESHSTRP